MVTRYGSIRGPLAPWASEVDGALIRLGYARRTAVTLVQLTGRFSGWLEAQGLAAGDVTPEVLGEFIGVERARGGWFQPTARTLGWLLELLADSGVTPKPAPTAPLSPVGGLLARYLPDPATLLEVIAARNACRQAEVALRHAVSSARRAGQASKPHPQLLRVSPLLAT